MMKKLYNHLELLIENISESGDINIDLFSYRLLNGILYYPK